MTPDTSRRLIRVEAVLTSAPESAKKTLREAFSGSASPRKAIKAMCLACVGYDRHLKRDDPLWPVRWMRGLPVTDRGAAPRLPGHSHRRGQ